MPEREYSVLGSLNDPDALLSQINESKLQLELSVISDDTHEPEQLKLKMISQGKEGFGYKFEYGILSEGSTIPKGRVKIVILNGRIDLTITTP